MADSTDDRLRRLSEKQDQRGSKWERATNIAAGGSENAWELEDRLAREGKTTPAQELEDVRQRLRRNARAEADANHKHTVRVLLGWIVAFTGFVAVVELINMISGIVLTASVNSPY